MKKRRKKVDPIPKSFRSMEEAGEFWDSHDTADYPDNFTTVHLNARIRRHPRFYKLEDTVARKLAREAKEKHLSRDVTQRLDRATPYKVALNCSPFHSERREKRE